MPAAAAGHVPPAFVTTSYEDIIQIIKSLPNQKLKGVRLEINAEFFGTTWAASDDCPARRIAGTVDKWKTKNAVLMVKWDGWSNNKQTPLDVLDKDSDGMSINLKLLDYADGSAAPEIHDDAQELAPTGANGRRRAARPTAGADDGDEDRVLM